MKKTLAVDQSLIENIIRYCEDKQVYDKLTMYGDFYYKLKLKMAGQSIADNLDEHSKQFKVTPKNTVVGESMIANDKGVFSRKPDNEANKDFVINIVHPVDSGYYMDEENGVLNITNDIQRATRFTREDANDLSLDLNHSREEWFMVVSLKPLYNVHKP